MAPAANDLARDLLGVVGVDRADVRGGAQPRVAIRVDPSRAAAYGATVHDILEAVHAATSMGTAEALAATPVGGRAAQIVLLADVATVEHGFGPRDTLVSSSGDGVVLVEVMAAQGVDRVAFEEAVTATVERAAPTFPASVDVIDPDDADLVVDVIGPVEGEPLVRIAAHLSELADELGADWVVGQVGAPHHPDLPRAIDDRTARLHLGWPEGPPERTRERLTDACGGHPGFSCWVRSPSSEMATLLVTADEDTGLEVAADVEAAAAVVSGVLSTHHVAPPRERTVSVLPDRDRLARLGLDSSDVTRTVRAATLGLPAGQLIDGDRLIPVVVNWGEIERSDLQALAALELLGSRQEAPIPLGEVCAIEIDAAPRSIHRVNGLWASTVLVELPSRGHGRVRKGVEAAVREVVLPGGTAVTFE
jgi:multidrug efflux pump subunit AcrB